MTMKTKEIRDSESPTEDYHHRQSNTNKNYYVPSKTDESDGNRRGTDLTGSYSVKPNEEYSSTVHVASESHSAASKWESSHTTVSVSEEVNKSDVHSGSKTIASERNNDNRQLTYDASYDKQNSANSTDTGKVTESATATNVDSVKREDTGKYSNGHQKVTETYTSNATDGDLVELASENLVSNMSSTRVVDNTYATDISTNKSENVETAMNTDNKIINELHQLDSRSSTQPITADASTKANSTASHDGQSIKRVDDQITDSSKENIEGSYTTTYQHSYQPPRISVDLSPSHEAFARSLRSTPERSSPSPVRERISPERRLKSVSPEKHRASPEKSGSPPKSIKSSARRKLSSTFTKDLSKKRANTPTRVEKYDSSDDSDCSGATHGTYDKYRGHDAKRSLFKEETKISSTSKYSQKSPSTSPVRREKSPGYSSEGSVGKEVRKSSSKVKNSSHESSPERSAFKPVQNYRAPHTQHATQNDKINLITEEDNVGVDNYTSKNNAIDANNYIRLIKPESEDDSNTNEYTETNIQNTVNSIRDFKNKSIREEFIIEEQISTSSEQVNNVKIEEHTTEGNRANREKSPSKVVKKENNLNQEKFIENEKFSSVVKENKKVNDVIITKPKEKSPTKEVDKPVAKGTTTYSRVKSSEKILQPSNSKTDTPTKKTTSAIPSSTKKTVPSSLEKTPSKKSLVHKDSKENVTHKTVKKDHSREKVDVKIVRDNSKTLIHKNSNGSITQKTLIKKPSQELIKDKKPVTSYRKVQLNSPETKPKTQNPVIKVIEKKDSTNKFKPSISPQSSQNKLRVLKTSAETKTTTDSKRNTENTNFPKKIPSTSATRPKTFTSTKPNVNETPLKATKTYSNPTTSFTAKSQTKKAVHSSSDKTVKADEVAKNVELKSKELEDELPPDAFESDTDLDDSIEKSPPAHAKHNSSGSPSSSSSEPSSEDEDDEGKQKIKELDDIRIEAEEGYGKKMTNKDGLLNVVVQLPQSSRESSPEYSLRFGQPYCSVSDDASLPRYADVVSEPEDVNDYRLHGERYDVVTDLDEDDGSKTTVADRVSKFLNNANKHEGIRTTEIPQSPQTVRKAKQLFESIAKGQIEETNVNNGDGNDDDDDNDANESEMTNTGVHGPPKHIVAQSPLLTRKISGASDYKTRKEFFESNKSNTPSERAKRPTPGNVTRSSSVIKDRRASFETNADKQTPSKDERTDVPGTRSPESKNGSPDRTTGKGAATTVVKTDVFDVKTVELDKSRKPSGSKTVRDRTATFERNEIVQKQPIKGGNKAGGGQPSSGTGRMAYGTYGAKPVASPSKSPDRKTTAGAAAKSPERTAATADRRANDTPSRQRTVAAAATAKSSSTSATAKTTTVRSSSVNATDDEVQIEDIFDLHVLEIMVNMCDARLLCTVESRRSGLDGGPFKIAVKRGLGG